MQELQKASSELPRDPSCSRGPIICQLTGSEKMPAPSATEKSFTALICEVKREGSDEVLNTLKSRYSAFLDVKDKLEANSIWKAQVSPIPFPPKSVFGRFESAIIKDRIEGITAWLNTVLAIPNLKVGALVKLCCSTCVGKSIRLCSAGLLRNLWISRRAGRRRIAMCRHCWS